MVFSELKRPYSVYLSSQTPSLENNTRFADEFLQPDVLAFFQEHRNALQVRPPVYCHVGDSSTASSLLPQSMFSYYAMLERHTSAEDASARSWAAVQSARTKMPRKALLQFAHDYKIIPQMLLRQEFTSLLKEAARL